MLIFEGVWGNNPTHPTEWEFEICPDPQSQPRIRVWDRMVGGKRQAKPIEVHEFFVRQWWTSTNRSRPMVIGPETQCGECSGPATARRLGGQSVAMATCLFCGIHGWYTGKLF